MFVGQQQGYAPPPQQYPPGQYPPGPQHTQTTVVMAQPTVAVMQQFRESPVHTRCPHCQAEVVTGTTYESGTFAWIICVILCVIGLVSYQTDRDFEKRSIFIKICVCIKWKTWNEFTIEIK